MSQKNMVIAGPPTGEPTEAIRQRLNGKIGGEWCAGDKTGLGWQGTDLPQQWEREACEGWYVDSVTAPPAGRSYAADCSSGCALCVYGQHPRTGKYRRSASVDCLLHGTGPEVISEGWEDRRESGRFPMARK